MTVTMSLSNDIAACLQLRRMVFVVEQGVSEADELDELDDDCLHLLARDGDRPVGTARIHVVDGEAKIGRVCVLSSHRGTGLGAALIRMAMDVVRERGLKQAKLGAQIHALRFYEKLGFTAFGPVFDDAGIDHRMMAASL